MNTTHNSKFKVMRGDADANKQNLNGQSVNKVSSVYKTDVATMEKQTS